MSAFPPTDATRPTAARMARIHLRAGLVALARAELETMAGLGELDGPAVADLAEARWRSGDLAGAGEAARAHLDGGGDDPVAFVVAAEADAARGRFADARALAAAVEARADVPAEELRLLLGGRTRAPIWNDVDPPVADAQPQLPLGAPPLSEPPLSELPLDQPPVGELPAAPGPPDDAFVRAGPAADAARLGLALRQRSLGPAEALERAEAELRSLPDAARNGPIAAALHLVRGDAYRMLGREVEAGTAYRACWTALEQPAPDDAASQPLEPLASPSEPQPEEAP